MRAALRGEKKAEHVMIIICTLDPYNEARKAYLNQKNMTMACDHPAV
jgi:hypothetical protein